MPNCEVLDFGNCGLVSTTGFQVLSLRFAVFVIGINLAHYKASGVSALIRSLKSMVHNILMVDDDATLLHFVKKSLEERKFRVDIAKSGREGVELVLKSPKKYSVVIVDYQMEGQNGAETTKSMLEINPNLFILIYSGGSTRDEMILSSRNGARGFVLKGEGPEDFFEEVNRMCALFEKEAVTVCDLTSSAERRTVIAEIGMVGESSALAGVAERAKKLRGKSGPVLILGESGTGKELIARALHGDRKGPFVAVNCANFLMSKGTARSELFGHVKGAFTGADRDKLGIFEEAGEGTIFLDEIYSLPSEAQVGLLRAIQEKVITRVGSTQERKMRCRIIAAAKPGLTRDIAEENFKSDLYYRISQNVIEIPPLRERPDDIAPLVAHFCKVWSQENGEDKIFLANTVPALSRYSWPGNIRELENVVYSVLNTSERNRIGAEDLGKRFLALSELPVPGKVSGLKTYLEMTEKAHVIEIASRCRTVREAAQELDLSPQGVLRVFKKYGLVTSAVIGSKLIKEKGAVK